MKLVTILECPTILMTNTEASLAHVIKRTTSWPMVPLRMYGQFAAKKILKLITCGFKKHLMFLGAWKVIEKLITLFSPLKYPLTNRYPSSNNVPPSVEKKIRFY